MTEQPGRLYLGCEFDLATQQPSADRVSISTRELTTHAVCLGMTGTGKTGLGIVLLEELLLQDVPLIIIDPKGDITNLVLTFPDLAPGDFRPWIDEEEAIRQRISPDELATQTAQRWRAGLSTSHIEPVRVPAIRASRRGFQFPVRNRTDVRPHRLHPMAWPRMPVPHHETRCGRRRLPRNRGRMFRNHRHLPARRRSVRRRHGFHAFAELNVRGPA